MHHVASTFRFSERPIQENVVSADTDNRQVLPILSADISAENEAKNWYIEPQNLYRIFSNLVLISFQVQILLFKWQFVNIFRLYSYEYVFWVKIFSKIPFFQVKLRQIDHP